MACRSDPTHDLAFWDMVAIRSRPDTPLRETAMGNPQAGRAILIAAFLLMIGTDLATRIIWFRQFGFSAIKLGSILVECILFFFAYRGSAIARWITVACGVLG